MHRCSDIPLKERVFRTSSLSKLSVQPPLLLPAARPSCYKLYSELHLQKAYESVRDGSLSIRRAAEEFGVPRSTLHDHTSGHVLPGAVSGPKRHQTNEEEEELVHFLLGCASIGYGRTRKEIISLVQQIVNKKGSNATVTLGWLESFRRRHPEISLRTPEPISHTRAACSSDEVLRKYFELLGHTLEDNDLLRKPCQIFNTDETGMPLDPSHPLIAAGKGQQHPQGLTSGNKSQITVLSCCSAAGIVLPPLIIFDRKALKAEMTKDEVPGTMYGLSENGWIDGELFDFWFCHHFLAYAPPA